MLLVNDLLNDYLLMPERIIGFALIMVGIATVFFAKRLAKVITKQPVQKGNKTYAKILTFALVAILCLLNLLY